MATPTAFQLEISSDPENLPVRTSTGMLFLQCHCIAYIIYNHNLIVPIKNIFHLHQAGFQHRQANVVDTGISGDDAAGIGHHLLGDVEHRHHNIESIADEPDRHCRFEDPAHDEGRLKLCHVIVLGDHLDQLVAGDEGQDNACDG